MNDRHSADSTTTLGSDLVAASDGTGAESMTVLAVNKHCWTHPQAGGAEVNLRETLTRLAERGFDVSLLCGAYPGCERTERLDDVRVRRVGFGSSSNLVLTYLAVSASFYSHSRVIDPDVVYVVETPLPWPIATTAPRIAIFHHIAIDSFFETHPFPANWVGSLSQRAGVRRDRHTPTVSVSPSTTSALLSRGHSPRTVHEIRNGIDVARYTPGAPDERSPEPRLVYVGALASYKGADRLPAIHRTTEAAIGAPVHLDVAGRGGGEREAIETYCKRTPTAHFHGFVTEAEKISLLRRAWAFVAPSRIEGWGIAVLEANACGTPAIGADVEGLRDSIRDGETGLRTDADDPEDFATAIARVLGDDTFRAELGENARTWAEAHSWEEATDDLETLFLDTIGRTHD